MDRQRTKQLEEISDYAKDLHASVNHTYDGKPYGVHLTMVYHFGFKFKHLLSEDFQYYALASCWTHDLIEDCRVTFNDLHKKVGYKIANVTYKLTNYKGKTRAKRANKKYYRKISGCLVSTFVKICDRLANASYSKESGSSMFEKYKAEHANFRDKLYHPEFQEMWDELDAIFEIN